MSTVAPVESIRDLVDFRRRLAERGIGLKVIRFERISNGAGGYYQPASHDGMGITRKVEAHHSTFVTLEDGAILSFGNEANWSFVNDTATVTTRYLILGYQIVRGA